MAKILNVTIPDDVHELLELIKDEKGFANNAEALVWIIKRAAGVEEERKIDDQRKNKTNERQGETSS